mmetsp:Transcript_87064/g.127329  ORF Transcript_87064/g.127329 Transcript_87064/m.127329 type:complete len:104 (-) Transcript_87064:300-611(-)
MKCQNSDVARRFSNKDSRTNMKMNFLDHTETTTFIVIQALCSFDLLQLLVGRDLFHTKTRTNTCLCCRWRRGGLLHKMHTRWSSHLPLHLWWCSLDTLCTVRL